MTPAPGSTPAPGRPPTRRNVIPTAAIPVPVDFAIERPPQRRELRVHRVVLLIIALRHPRPDPVEVQLHQHRRRLPRRLGRDAVFERQRRQPVHRVDPQPGQRDRRLHVRDDPRRRHRPPHLQIRHLPRQLHRPNPPLRRPRRHVHRPPHHHLDQPRPHPVPDPAPGPENRSKSIGSGHRRVLKSRIHTPARPATSGAHPRCASFGENGPTPGPTGIQKFSRTFPLADPHPPKCAHGFPHDEAPRLRRPGSRDLPLRPGWVPTPQ